MITISTTTDREARAMAVVMIWAPPDLDYGIYLLGRQVAFSPPPPDTEIRDREPGGQDVPGGEGAIFGDQRSRRSI